MASRGWHIPPLPTGVQKRNWRRGLVGLGALGFRLSTIVRTLWGNKEHTEHTMRTSFESS